MAIIGQWLPELEGHRWSGQPVPYLIKRVFLAYVRISLEVSGKREVQGVVIDGRLLFEPDVAPIDR
jgi:hypothetical protein